MKVEDFNLLCSVLKQRSGLVLSQDKTYLVESRLTPIVRKYGMNSLDQLISVIRVGKNEPVIRDVTEAMTTNESSFFRDSKPFDTLRELVIPKLLEARRGERKIRVWSAACSSGQEAYSVAMLIREQAQAFAGWRIEIIATDISDDMLAKARAGIYTQFEVQRGLPINLMVKYFQKSGDKWQIDANLRSMVQYRNFNLLDDPLALGRFDVVFCRNVLIYFDGGTKTKVLDGISRILAPDGVLFLGGAETVLGVSEKLAPIPGQRGVYQLSGTATQQPPLSASA
jgi:chemotaxis protein methyltransferase CheR